MITAVRQLSGGEPYLSLTWADAQTGARGHLVIDSLRRGIAGGGLRMRDGCTREEVADLARAMTHKEAIAFRPGARYLPVGGAKGGIDFDPASPDAPGVLRRYLEAMRPMIDAHWAFGEDLGVRQDELDELAHELGMRSTVDVAMRYVDDGPDRGRERLQAAFASRERGVGLDELVGGYGVATAAVTGLRAIGRDPQSSTAVIQGFGSMGGATGRYLADAGVSVIAVADSDGLVFNPQGLHVETLLRTRDRRGRLDRSSLGPGDVERPRDAWTAIPADLFVPAATSYVIDETVAAELPVGLVVEAANVATLPGAEATLTARGIPVVPDIIANLATNAWWWWTLFGDIAPTPAASFTQIDTVIGDLVQEAFAATAPGSTLRTAALHIAQARARQAEAEAMARGDAAGS